MTVTFFRLNDVAPSEKATQLRSAINACAPNPRRYELEARAFDRIPGSPFAYWAGDQVRDAFGRFSALQQDRRRAVFGASTKDDKRYLRIWTELPMDGATRPTVWRPFAKGGQFSPYYSDIHLVVKWTNDGEELKTDIAEYRGSRGWGFHWTAALNGYDSFFRPGLTWPRRSQIGLGLRVMPAGGIFGDKGPAVFVEGDSAEELLALLAVTTSAPFVYLVELQMAFGSYEVGVLQRTPVPDAKGEEQAILAQLARRAWSHKRTKDTASESSHAFTLPSILYDRVTRIDGTTIDAELVEIRREVDGRVFALYGFSPVDRGIIEASLAARTGGNESPAQEDEDEAMADEADEEEEAPGAGADALISWCVGVAFSRFDPRLATGERPLPPEPEPFDPLAARSPGMWPADEPQDPPPPPLLLDDPGHKLDLAAKVTAVATRVSCTVPETLRAWLAHDFFPLHIKMYSKSRRKAPIYWQLATPSASYSVWLYIHAFSKDTLYQAQKHVDDKLDHEQRQLERMRSEFGPSPSAAERGKLDTQGTFVDELRAMLEEVQRVAPLWSPNLDDGVLINFAPLHRLVPQNKSWQQELRTTWAALARGEYDWAHLAMHLWPERVVPKCATDRSLAIAHGLEEVFWSEAADKKWKARTAPTRPIDHLVRERTSAAVRAALKSLDEAPVAGHGSKKPRAGKRRK